MVLVLDSIGYLLRLKESRRCKRNVEMVRFLLRFYLFCKLSLMKMKLLIFRYIGFFVYDFIF